MAGMIGLVTHMTGYLPQPSQCEAEELMVSAKVRAGRT